MFTKLREPFGKAGLIVAVVALVAALVGGAYAANGTNSGDATASAKKKKSKGVTVQQVRKIAKQEARKFANSNPGPAGPQGPAGPAGPKGDNGSNGSNGQDGTNGTNGTNGTSVTGVAATVGECPAGGVKYTSASGDNAVCNGEDGEDGETGFTETLPSEKTETGVWSYLLGPSGFGFGIVSWSIPLPSALDESHVVIIPQEGEGTVGECSSGATKGTAGNPLASPGYLCVYITVSEGAILSATEAGGPNPGASKVGSVLLAAGEEGQVGHGTFAVTAP